MARYVDLRRRPWLDEEQEREIVRACVEDLRLAQTRLTVVADRLPPSLRRKKADRQRLYVLSRDPILLLRRHVSHGAAARFIRWFEHHALYAHRCALRWARILGCDPEDLETDAQIGLMYALARYDPSRGAKVTTWSDYWIMSEVLRGFSRSSGIVRVPHGAHDKVSKWEQARAAGEDIKLSGEDWRLWADVRMALMDPIFLGEPVFSSRLARHLGVSRFRVWADDPQDDHETYAPFWEEILPSAAEPFTDMWERERIESIFRLLEPALRALAEFEKQVIYMHYLLNMSYEEIADYFHRSRARIRQIEIRALAKLRQAFYRTVANRLDAAHL